MKKPPIVTKEKPASQIAAEIEAHAADLLKVAKLLRGK